MSTTTVATGSAGSIDEAAVRAGRPPSWAYHLYRWYEWGTGRYTRPDPLGLHIGSRTEAPTHPFAFVGSRPTRFKDTLGLFEMDDSCRCLSGRDSGVDKPSRDQYAHLVSSVSQACRQLPNQITDVPLRRCIGDSCDSGTVFCRQNCPSGQLGGTTDTVGAAILNVFGGAIRTAKLCVNNWPDLQRAGAGAVAIHEWAHGCGWLHGEGQGVPGRDGTF